MDVLVYGATSAGVIAAYTAKQYGHSVLLVEPGRHLGGMSSGGLGHTDIGNKYAVTGLGLDFWLLALGVSEIAAIAAGVEIIITVLKTRAPGMTLSRLPLYGWAMLVTGFMLLFAFTTLLMGSLLMRSGIMTQLFDALDRKRELLETAERATAEAVLLAGKLASSGVSEPVEGLPLELCDLVVWLTAFACLRASVPVTEFIYFAGLGGSAMALLTPDLWAPLFSYPTLYFFGGHGAVVVSIIVLVFGKQVQLRPAPGEWAIWQLASNMAGGRLYWLCFMLREDDLGASALFKDGGWEDTPDNPRTAAELVDAFEKTWDVAQGCLDRWSLADLNVEVTRNNFWGQPTTISPAWVLWRIMSHEAHHGSEIALILRMHGLPTLIAM